MTVERKWCRECRDEVTGSDDGTGLSYCHDCDEAKDDEHVLVLASDSRGAVARIAELEAELEPYRKAAARERSADRQSDAY
jgi:hypothetical protein